MHDPSLIATIAAGFAAAWLLGLLAQWLFRSPIVGYILAGVAIGPHTPGFQGDLHVAQQLAEVGVILLMFGVGLHFHWKDLVAVRHVAIPGAIGQSTVATVLAVVIFTSFGMPLKVGAVIGMAMSVASTVVLMRVLMDANVIESPQGHIAVGWLIVEDVFTVVLLVLIPILGEKVGSTIPEIKASLAWTLAAAFFKLTALTAIVLLGGSRFIPWVLVRVARLRSRELFTLTILVFSVAIAAASYFFFGASMALGAFLAGMVVGQSAVSHQAAADALPMRDAFAVLFFVAVGMLFDPSFVIRQPLMLIAALGIVLIAKPLAALIIVALLGQSVTTALTVAVGLAQIGEFSFIVSDLAREYGLMNDDGHNVLVASAILSITLNPMIFRSLPTIEAWLRRRPVLWNFLNRKAAERTAAINRESAEQIAKLSEATHHSAIVVGYGPVGRSVHRLLREAGFATIIIDMNMETIAALKTQGVPAIYGDATHESILLQAGLASAQHLVLTLPQPPDRIAIVAAARSLNPAIRILVRARYLRERHELVQAGATAAVFEEAEAAVALARLVLADTGMHREAADRKIKDLRLQLIEENITNIRTQRVRSVMVPWSRVRWLSSSANRTSIQATVLQERFSRWPVLNPVEVRPVGYLLTKDLIATVGESDWTQLIRPLKTIAPDDTVETALARMQSEGDSIYIVQDQRGPLGIITLEDILEQVVGQIEDEYPHETRVSLADALTHGAIHLNLESETGADAIRELILMIPNETLPAGIDHEELIRSTLAREEDLSTDLGNGVAIPHVRYPGMPYPWLAFGRSINGIIFGPESEQLVHLVFLVGTPAEQPEIQLALLSQIAGIARDPSQCDALRQARTNVDVLGMLRE